MTYAPFTTGSQVVDPSGQKVGTLTDILADERTLEPQWAVVSFGMFHHQHRVVPASTLVTDADHHVVVSLDRDVVRHAPRISTNEALTPDVERELARYYGNAA